MNEFYIGDEVELNRIYNSEEDLRKANPDRYWYHKIEITRKQRKWYFNWTNLLSLYCMFAVLAIFDNIKDWNIIVGFCSFIMGIYVVRFALMIPYLHLLWKYHKGNEEFYRTKYQEEYGKPYKPTKIIYDEEN